MHIASWLLLFSFLFESRDFSLTSRTNENSLPSERLRSRVGEFILSRRNFYFDRLGALFPLRGRWTKLN